MKAALSLLAVLAAAAFLLLALMIIGRELLLELRVCRSRKGRILSP